MIFYTKIDKITINYSFGTFMALELTNILQNKISKGINNNNNNYYYYHHHHANNNNKSNIYHKRGQNIILTLKNHNPIFNLL